MLGATLANGPMVRCPDAAVRLCVRAGCDSMHDRVHPHRVAWVSIVARLVKSTCCMLYMFNVDCCTCCKWVCPRHLIFFLFFFNIFLARGWGWGVTTHPTSNSKHPTSNTIVQSIHLSQSYNIAIYPSI